ncbi:anti-sigma factor [Flaviflexus huanghaiensis]|uniref:anti-sigma factor n=1 Tax=Flaviflexus huanghaiensis TaxID=1111473 RepID=UPI0015FB1D5C|nr:anti-sigma factor [Flaviflexus huanghaiensis]
MIDREYLAAGLIFGGLSRDDEELALSLEQDDPDFAHLVADFAEAESALALSDSSEQPSAEITARILAIPQGTASPAHVGDNDSSPNGVVSLDTFRRESRWKRTSLALAGVGAAASLAFGVVVFNLASELGELREEMEAVQSERGDLERLMQADDLSIADASLPGDESAKITVMASVNEGLVRVQTANITIPEGQDMQMWLISSDGATPMGLIDTSHPGVESLPIPSNAELGFTMEPAGGTDTLDGPPVVSIKL